MNFKQLNDIAYLKQLMQDSDILNEVITETRGFVLALMEEQNLFPSLDELIKKENIYSLNFIIKNYELDNQQVKQLKKYFNVDAENKVSKNNLSETEIKEYLEEEQLLSKNTILNKDILNNYTKEIAVQFNIDEYIAEEILKNSFLQLPVEELITLNPLILKEYSFLFKDEEFISHFKNEKFNQLFKDLLLNSGYKLTVEDFNNYHFQKEDKSFLKNLLNSQNYYSVLNYDTITKLNGATQLIAEKEFITDIKSHSLKGINDENLINLKDIVRKQWMKLTKKEGLNKLSQVMNMECSLEQFKIIVDQTFFNNLIDSMISEKYRITLNQYDYEHNDLSQKQEYIYNLAMNYILENKEKRELLKWLPIGEVLSKVTDDYNRNFSKDINYINFYEQIIPILLKTENLDSWLEYSNKIISNNTIKLFNNVITKTPSINSLALIMSSLELSSKSHFLNREYLEEIMNKLILQLNKEDVIILTNYYNINLNNINLKQELINDNKVNITPISDTIYNFLSIKNVNLKDYEKNSPYLFTLLMLLKKEIRQEIIESNYIMEDKTLMSLINSYQHKLNESESMFLFLKKYIGKNQEMIIKNENLKILITKSPHGNKLLLVDNKETEEIIYQKWKSVINVLDNTDDHEQVKLREEYNKQLSSHFLEMKIKELIKNENFKEIEDYFSKYQRAYLNVLFEDIKNNSFDTILKKLENKSFKVMLLNEIIKGYNSNITLKLNQLSNNENKIIAELLVQDIKNSSSDDKIKILRIFPKEKSNFSNDFIIKYMPEELFSNYNLRHNNSVTELEANKYYAVRPYTTKEILQAYRNLEKKNIIFNEKSMLNIVSFIINNFEPNKEKEGFLQLIEESKKYPLFYVILAQSDILGHFYSKLSGNMDEDVSRYFLQNFDMKIINQGMKEMFLKWKEQKNLETIDSDSSAQKNIIKYIKGIINNTFFYERRANNNEHSKNSVFEKKESKELIKILFSRSITTTLYFDSIGSYNIEDELENNLKEYIVNANYSLDNLLYLKDNLLDRDFSPNLSNKDGSRFNTTLLGYINGLINYYADKENDEMIYFSYLIQQYKFFKEELSYKARNLIPHLNNTIIIDNLCKDEELVNKITKISRKFFLEKVLSQKDNIIKKVKKL